MTVTLEAEKAVYQPHISRVRPRREWKLYTWVRFVRDPSNDISKGRNSIDWQNVMVHAYTLAGARARAVTYLEEIGYNEEMVEHVLSHDPLDIDPVSGRPMTWSGRY